MHDVARRAAALTRAVSASGPALAALFLTSGCLKLKEMRAAPQRDWLELHPDAPAHVKRAVLGKRLVEGMTTDAVRASWGEPQQAADLGGGIVRWTYNRKQDVNNLQVNVEYLLVFNRGVLIRIHRQRFR